MKKSSQDFQQNLHQAKLEENPKLKLVADVLKEIRESEDNKTLGPPVTLIVCAEDRTCSQLKQVCIYHENVDLFKSDQDELC